MRNPARQRETRRRMELVIRASTAGCGTSRQVLEWIAFVEKELGL